MALRLWRLDFESFWFDEVSSIEEADLPIVSILTRFHWPPVYSLVLKPLASSISSEALLRLPAALLGAITILVFHRSIARETPAWIAGGVSLLFATSAFHIELSQHVRHYTLGILAMWLCHRSYCDLIEGEGGSWRQELLWAAAGAFAYLSIFLALPLLLVQMAHAVFVLRSGRRVRFVATALGLVAILSPWLLGSTQQVQRVPNQLRYGGGHWEGLSDALIKTHFGYLSMPAWAGVAALLAIAGILAAGLSRERRALTDITLLAYAGLLAGLALLTAYVSDPYPRYFTLTLPFFYALLARSLANLSARVAAPVLGLLALVSIVSGAIQLLERQHPDWRSMAQKVATADFPRCTFVFGMPNMQKSLLWYLRRDHPGIGVEVHSLEGGYTLDASGAQKIRREIDAIAARTTCLVYVQGFEWFSDRERLVIQYLMLRYPWSFEVSKFPAATAFRLTEPAAGDP